MLHIVQAVVHEELELGDDAELFADAGAELIADLPHIGVDVLHYFLGPLAWEDAEVAAAHAHVGTDAASTHAHQHPSHRTCLLLKNVAEFLLNESRYLVLSGCFHIIKLRVKNEE